MQQPFHTIFITNAPADARRVAQASVDRVMVDLEYLGKDARQGHLDTVISRHAPQDIVAVAEALSDRAATVLVRVDPVHPGSDRQIDDVIARGADRLMLPMFQTAEEVARALAIVRGRVPATLLVETPAALVRLPQILALDGDYDLHIGLNDLHLAMGLDFMFEIVAGRLLDDVAQQCRDAGRAFAIGGVAPVDAQVALSGEMVLGEYARLGAAGTILGRPFRAPLQDGADAFCAAVTAVRRGFARMQARDADGIAHDQARFRDVVARIAAAKAGRD